MTVGNRPLQLEIQSMSVSIYAASFAALLGLAGGSFVNSCVYRLPRNISLWQRSFCPACRHRLGWFELVPIVSFAFLRGRCRHCQVRIPILYPITEMISAIGLVWLAACSESPIDFLICAVLFLIMLAISLIDMQFLRIPNVLTAWLFFAGVLKHLLRPEGIIDGLSGMAVGGGLLLLFGSVGLLLKKKFGFGAGDIKLTAALGFIFGMHAIATIITLAVITGAIYGIIGMAVGWLNRSSKLPFGAFIGLGTLCYLAAIN
jgi:leader peptidase (prepilin peptidase)/N-methyltransferase